MEFINLVIIENFLINNLVTNMEINPNIQKEN